MKKLFYIIAIVFIGAALMSCQGKKSNANRKQIKVEYPQLGYLYFYEDDMSIAEPYTEFDENKKFSYFYLESHSERKGWDMSRTGVLDANKKIIVPPFLIGIITVWDPAVQEYYFLGKGRSYSKYHVFDLSGKQIAIIDWQVVTKLKNISKRTAVSPSLKLELRNFKEKI